MINNEEKYAIVQKLDENKKDIRNIRKYLSNYSIISKQLFDIELSLVETMGEIKKLYEKD